MKYNISLFIILFLLTSISISQVYNANVEAKLFINTENNLTKVVGTAFNKTEISQSIRYVLSVIKTNLENNNRSKNDQSGRIVLSSGQKSELSQTSFIQDTKDKIIVLLLIYDDKDNIIGKDRFVFNDKSKESGNQLKEKLSKNIANKDVSSSNEDGVFLKGLVLEQVKTKPARDFYKIFYSDYLLKEINGAEIVTIDEKLILANSTIVRVLVGDKLVYRFLVKPQNDYLKQQSNESIRRVSLYLENIKKNNIVKHY